MNKNAQRRKLRLPCICGIMAFSASLLSAATYYVATEGSNSNPGTRKQPFRTIQHAADRMQPGDVCAIRQGIYFEEVVPPRSGEPGRPIQFEAYPGEQVLVSCADTLSGWTKHKGNIYKAPMDWDLGPGENQIYVNGDAMFEARWPSLEWPEDKPGVTRTFSDERDYVEYIYKNDQQRPKGIRPIGPWRNLPVDNLLRPVVRATTCYDQISGKPINEWEGHLRVDKFNNVLYGKPDDYWNGVVYWGNGWWWSHAGIVTHSRDGDDGNGNPVTILHLHTDRLRWCGNGVFIGHLDFLNIEKEWALKDGTLYFYPPGGKDPSQFTVMAKRRHRAFNLKNLSCIDVTGLHILGGSIHLDSANACVIDNCHFRHLSHYWYHTWAEGGGPGSGVRSEVNAGKRGILVTGNDNIIRNSSIYKSAANGIIVQGDRNLVENCAIYFCDYNNTYASSLYITRGRDNIVKHCTLQHTGRSLITGGTHTKVLYNKLFDAMALSGDGGLIYTFGTGNYNFVLAYNWIKGCFGEPSTYIYNDGCGYGQLYHHNVFMDNPPALGKFGPLWYCKAEFFNNTLLADVQTKSHSVADRWEEGFVAEGLKINTLLASRNENTQKPYVDWKFVDSAGGDFRLQANSPAVDAGRAIHGITDGYIGEAPDLGAYEYGGEAWVPGHTWGDIPAADKLWRGSLPQTVLETGNKKVQPLISYALSGNKLSITTSRISPLSIKLMSIQGRLIFARETNTNQVVTLPAAGIYILSIDGKAFNITRRIVLK
ncbi:MAG: T9SS type A sorting domain-containing protein [Chitinivibrionales bacterium]|nr:T9SS type A sorting domain-containing protein [Chitinivibrionales bacterium]